ncbi:MAG: ABC transporter ATP-binding protein [Geminicoccaceae bacterium]
MAPAGAGKPAAVAKPAIGTAEKVAIGVRDLSVRFDTEDGGVTALEALSIDISAGGLMTMLGPSGCGKSTLLRAIADLVPASGGEISVFERTPEEARLARDFAFVFQDATLLPWRTALDNVRLPLEVGGSTATIEQPVAAGDLLALVGLEGRENALPHELSGGMRQRVAIARALICRPRILLMDEPFGALDEITRDKLNEELLRIWEETGTTIVFVTHSIPEAAFLGQHVLVLASNPGRVREVVEVDLPHPRKLAMRDTMEFVAVTAHLRQLLETC